ncbi:MAG: TRAM domain-containing protein [Methanobrevibacter sp.]|nr:TRAM domain-containing protein [Candidatus Methanoflexus mossambicus]
MFENSYNNRQEEFQVPVEIGTEYDVKIEDQGKTGDGIARIEGYVIFVPGTEVGQEVKVKINATRRKFGFAEKVE